MKMARKKHRSAFVKELFGEHPGAVVPGVRSAANRLRNALEENWSSLQYLKGIEPKTKIAVIAHRRRESICKAYLRAKMEDERPSIIEVKPYSAKIGRQLDSIIDTLERAPMSVRFSLYALLQYQYDDPNIIQNFLKDLRSACYEVSYFDGQVGRRKPEHIDTLVRDLAGLWTDITGRRVPKTLSQISADVEEFISPAAQFIFLCARAVDPDLTFASVRNALRRRHLPEVQVLDAKV